MPTVCEDHHLPSVAERRRAEAILKRLKIERDKAIVLIDARADNKPSGSKA